MKTYAIVYGYSGMIADVRAGETPADAVFAHIEQMGNADGLAQSDLFDVLGTAEQRSAGAHYLVHEMPLDEEAYAHVGAEDTDVLEGTRIVAAIRVPDASDMAEARSAERDDIDAYGYGI